MTKTGTATRTYWTIEAHQDLTPKTPCADPAACTKPGHWEWQVEETFKSEAAAEDFCENGSDFPAYRIFKVESVIKTQFVKALRFATEGG